MEASRIKPPNFLIYKITKFFSRPRVYAFSSQNDSIMRLFTEKRFIAADHCVMSPAKKAALQRNFVIHVPHMNVICEITIVERYVSEPI